MSQMIFAVNCTGKNNSSIKNIKDSVNIIDSIKITDSLRITDSTNIITSINYRDSIIYHDSIIYKTQEISNPFPPHEIKPISIRADSTGNNFNTSFLFDDSLYYDNENRGTRFAVSGYPHALIFYFDTLYLITSIQLNTFGWNEDYTHEIKVYSFSNLFLHCFTFPELWSKHNLFITSDHIYMEILSGKNSWTDIAEIKFFGYKLNNEVKSEFYRRFN